MEKLDANLLPVFVPLILNLEGICEKKKMRKKVSFGSQFLQASRQKWWKELDGEWIRNFPIPKVERKEEKKSHRAGAGLPDKLNYQF